MSAINKINELFSVRGLVAVITGGGSGLGLYAARALDANGAKAVYIVGRREQTLRDAAKTGENGSIIPIVGDVSSVESLKKVADQVHKEQGYLNLLYCNAGITGPSQFSASLPTDRKPTVKDFQEAMLGTNQEKFTSAYHVNCTAVYYTVAAFLDLLAEGNSKRNLPQDSQVLVTSSIAGFSRSISANYAYSTSKAATNHLVKTLATSFSQNGFHIRVNAIAPGLYPSEMTDSTTSKMEEWKGPAGHEAAYAGARVMPADRCPSERTGSEQDMAGTILFLASAAGSYVNGEMFVTDGGRLTQMPSVY